MITTVEFELKTPCKPVPAVEKMPALFSVRIPQLEACAPVVPVEEPELNDVPPFKVRRGALEVVLPMTQKPIPELMTLTETPETVTSELLEPRPGAGETFGSNN